MFMLTHLLTKSLVCVWGGVGWSGGEKSIPLCVNTGNVISDIIPMSSLLSRLLEEGKGELGISCLRLHLTKTTRLHNNQHLTHAHIK